MKLSKKTEYACLALIDLSEHYEGNLIKIQDIATNRKIPKKYLEQILLLLKNSGYVESIRGATGGYKLIKKPSDITLAEIIRLIDGPLAPVGSVSKYFYESTPIEQSKKMMGVLQNIRDYISDVMEKTTFADLIEGQSREIDN
jgi:Rrf2 family protein